MKTWTRTFTGTSSDLTNYLALSSSDVAGGDTEAGVQALRVAATSSTSSGSAEVEVVVFDAVRGAVVFRDVATVSVTTRRTASGGASGDYVGLVQFAVSGRDTVDVGGFHQPSGTIVYVGVTSLATIASLRLDVVALRRI